MLNLNRVFFEAPANIGQFNILTSGLGLIDQGFTGGNTFSNDFIESANFFRFDNFTIGYNLDLPETSVFGKMRFYVRRTKYFHNN